MNTQSTQRFVSDSASTRDSASRGSTYRNSTQRFVSDAASRLFAPQRLAPRRNASLRHALQRNNLLVTTSPCRNSTLLDLPHRFATSLNSTQQFVSDNALLRFAPTRLAALRPASPHNSTQRFVSNSAARRSATPHRATRLFSTQRFVSNSAPFCTSTIRGATPLFSTQRFVSDNDIASPLSAARRSAVHRIATLLNSTLSLNKGVQSCISDPLLH